MTDPTPPLSDEDLSAVLDGEAGPDVVARVQADPRARARLDALRAVSGAIRHHEVTPLDPATVDDLVGRALAVADEAPAATPATPPASAWPPPGGPAPDPVVTPLAPPRGNRNAPRFLVAAAIFALVAIGLGLVWSGTRSGETDTAGRTPSSEDFGSAADDGGGDAGTPASPDEGTDAEEPNAAIPSPTEGSESAEETPAATDLGSFADDDELRSALASGFPTGPAAEFDTTLGRSSVDRCDVQARHVFEIDGEPTDVGQAVVDGDDVLVLEYEGTSFADGETPATIVTALDPDTCNPRFTFERAAG